MKFSGYFVLTAAILLAISTQQSSGLGVSLCLGLNIPLLGCQNSKTPVANTNNSLGGASINGNEKPAGPKEILTNGFTSFNNTVATAEEKAINGFPLDIELGSIGQAAQKAVQNATDILYEAGVIVFVSLGEASSLSNSVARQGLIEVSQEIQLALIKVCDVMKTAITLVNQGSSIGGEEGKQAIEAARETIKAAYGVIYCKIQNSYQQSIQTISDNQNQNNTMEGEVQNQNTDYIANDTDASAAISNISTIINDSIKRGYNASIVNQLSLSSKQSVAALAQLASDVKNNFAHVEKLAETDPSSARTEYLKYSKDIGKRIQEIVANTFLSLGTARAKFGKQMEDQIGNAIKSIEKVNAEVIVAIINGDQLSLSAIKLRGDARILAFRAAEQSGRYCKTTLIEIIVKALKTVLL